MIPNTLWFEAAVVLGIFAVGNVLFGHFEEHLPKWKRLLKMALTTMVVLQISITFGRAVALALVGFMLGVAVYVHCWWLPKRGINGWTGEPREKYLLLVGAKAKEPPTSCPKNVEP